MENDVKPSNSRVLDARAADMRGEEPYPWDLVELSEIKQWVRQNNLLKLELPPSASMGAGVAGKRLLGEIFEYLEGASLVTDPLPSKIRNTYLDRDAFAMRRDWDAAAGDLNAVYSALVDAIADTGARRPFEHASQKATNDRKPSAG